ncbi:hypothetical protein BC941DRAFT_423683 [Chlamydoabsidia padenii]|nr:hypothetical protein BC941DRAFT_423683 [Chlamydoabsidia padenii]
MGVQDVQVEPVLSIDRDYMHSLRPVYGIIVFLHEKATTTGITSNHGSSSTTTTTTTTTIASNSSILAPSSSSPSSSTSLHLHGTGFNKDETITNNDRIYFANQVVNNAYAMHALLSILLNCEIINIGSTLADFKEFTKGFSPMLKGLSLSNSHTLRKSHNNVGRLWPARSNNKPTYQYIGYVPFEGYLWELDGVKRGPLRLGPCTEKNWLDILQYELSRKTEGYQKQHIPFSVWSVIEDRRKVLQRKLVTKLSDKNRIETQLDEYHLGWKLANVVQRWEEEYQHAMKNEYNRRGMDVSTHMTMHSHRPVDDSPPDDRPQQQQPLDLKEQIDSWLQAKDEILRLYNGLGKEAEKHQSYQSDTIRRQHDYGPFITAYLDALQTHGILNRLVSDSS